MTFYRVVYVTYGEPGPDHPGPWYVDTFEAAREKIADLMDCDLRPELKGGTGEGADPDWMPLEAWCETTEELSPFYVIEERY